MASRPWQQLAVDPVAAQLPKAALTAVEAHTCSGCEGNSFKLMACAPASTNKPQHAEGVNHGLTLQPQGRHSSLDRGIFDSKLCDLSGLMETSLRCARPQIRRGWCGFTAPT